MNIPVNRFVRCLFTIVFLSAVPTELAFGLELSNESALSDILAQWRSYQDAASVVDIRWQSDKFMSTPFLLGLRDGDAMNQSKTVVETVQLTLDKTSRVRYELNSERWSKSQDTFVPSTQIFADDGSKQTLYFPKGAVRFPDAHIGGANIENILNVQDLLAPRLVFRAFDPLIGVLAPDKLVLTSDKAFVNERPVYVLRQPGERSRSVWIDPTRSMLPVRYIEVDNHTGTVKWQVDIEYKEHSQLKWVPASWIMSFLAPDGSIIQSETTRVVDCQINVSVDDSVFQIEIPDGTYVHDGLSKEKYAIRKDGQKRKVLRGELTGNNFQQILNSEPGDALRQPSGSKRWLVFCNVVIVAFLLCLVVYNYVAKRNPALK